MVIRPRNKKREIIDRIKSKVARVLPSLSVRRLRENPRPQWQEAYSLRGTGTARPRANRIEAIFAKAVLVPSATAEDREAWEFLDEVRSLVHNAISEVKQEIARAESKHS